MKKHGKLVAALLTAALLVGCSSGGSSIDSMQSASAVGDYSMNMAESYSSGAEGYDSIISSQQTEIKDQKITYTASVRMESTEFDEILQNLNKTVKKYNAYYESSDISGNSDDSTRYASFTIKTPVSNYSEFLNEMKSSGNVLSVTENAENITSSYIDVQSRLSALSAQRTRLNELADAAESTSDLLEIESQLSDVQYQIENYTSQMHNLENQVSYSTINISINEVAILTPVNVAYSSQVVTAFFSGWSAFVRFVKEFVLGIVYLLPLIVLASIVVVVIVVAEKKKKAKRENKKKYVKKSLPCDDGAVKNDTRFQVVDESIPEQQKDDSINNK